MAEDAGGDPLYSCKNCRNPLAFRSDLLSKAFLAKSGQAYMFSHVMNAMLGKKEDKQLITGLFTISKTYCSKCGEELGWMYVKAYDPKQMFKQGRFIIEKAKIVKQY
ncbi:hypothetical protein K2173_026530 [Erythroxylum novogranatense]|uniref:Protein yippee-like n=1 Tax=Erythroxylum novogranatense TaxID=1862640 RepID=A0AAV8TYZ8_9ROSI|nr:hypothetical protein K2173_026530 [Erythroxylum novogranatense]